MAKARVVPHVIPEDKIILELTRDEALMIHTALANINSEGAEAVALPKQTPYDIYKALHNALYPDNSGGREAFTRGDLFRKFMREYR